MSKRRQHNPEFKARVALEAVKGERTLNELIEMFSCDPGRKATTDKTKVDYGVVFDALRETIGGDIPVDQIERDHCRDIRSLFLALPPNARKRFPGKPLRGMAQKNQDGELGRLVPKTINSHIAKMNTLFRWAEAEGYISKNPARGLRFQGGKSHSRDARLPFSDEQLQSIFSAPLCLPSRSWSAT